MGTTELTRATWEGRDLSADVDVISPTELVAIWLNGKSPATLKTYAAGIKDFSRFVGASSPAEAATMLISRGRGRCNSTARQYKNDLVERGLSPSTVNVYLGALRSLISLAEQVGLVNWSLKIRGVRAVTYKDTSGPGLEVVKRMIATALTRGDEKSIRDATIMIMLHDLGLRRGEICSLDLEHVDLAGGKLLVLGKGHMERLPMTMPESVRGALGSWIRVRGDSAGPLFTNLAHDPAVRGKRLSGSGLHRIVKRAGEAVGVNVRPHGLRHSGVTVALDQTGGDVRRVSKFSRHASIATVLLYDDARQDLGGKVAALVSAAREAAG